MRIGELRRSGRVYDYRLGRFLSVDPVIANLADAQTLNPYSYVGNNPLAVTDPSGFMRQAIPDRDTVSPKGPKGSGESESASGSAPKAPRGKSSSESSEGSGGAGGATTPQPQPAETSVIDPPEDIGGPGEQAAED